jgi:regulator of replication initiation timing
MSDITYLTDLVKTLLDEVKTLRVENNQLREEFKTFCEETRPKRRVIKSKDPIEKCSCKTIKGTPCKNSRLEGKAVCAKHEKQMETHAPGKEPLVSKKPRVKKPIVKKVVPMHNHPIGESPRDGLICELCETHGDILDPDMPDAEFEVVPVNGQSLEERLRIMLESEG